MMIVVFGVVPFVGRLINSRYLITRDQLVRVQILTLVQVIGWLVFMAGLTLYETAS